ncbi:unnamed protein product [Ectocarpus sp. 8 AP-2014]
MSSFGGGSGSMLVLNDPAAQLSSVEGKAAAPAAPVTNLSAFASSNDIVVKVHPMVLFSVLDHYLRRPENQKRVIGTLLGTVTANVVEITNSFAVPHLEKNDEVAVGKDFNKSMLALQQRVNGRESVVGWYATSFDGVLIVDDSSLIHDFYTGECERPVHLVVDTALKNNIVGCKAFISTPLEIDGSALANVFHEVKVSLVSAEAERICIDRMVKGQEEAFTTPEGLAEVDSRMASLETSMQRLVTMLQQAEEYVGTVVDGKLPADPHMGRKLADTLAAIPRMRPEAFNRLFDDNLQDLLMVSYLSSLTRTQLAIAEKLAT